MSKVESTLAETNHDDGGEFIQVRKKSERSNNDKNSASTGINDKKKPKPRSRNNSIGEGKPYKTRYVSSCISSSNHVSICLSDPGIHQPTMDALPRWILEMEENSREQKTRPARRVRLPGTTRTKNGGPSTLDSLKEEQAQRILPRFLR